MLLNLYPKHFEAGVIEPSISKYSTTYSKAVLLVVLNHRNSVTHCHFTRNIISKEIYCFKSFYIQHFLIYIQ